MAPSKVAGPISAITEDEARIADQLDGTIGCLTTPPNRRVLIGFPALNKALSPTSEAPEFAVAADPRMDSMAVTS
jgi:hypothetical protein